MPRMKPVTAAAQTAVTKAQWKTRTPMSQTRTDSGTGRLPLAVPTQAIR